ncbi:MAG: GNAT family N-acetyltransferase [Terracidiphilus sp.]
MIDAQDISLIEKLTAFHNVRTFTCGEHSLDLYLRKYALANQRADSSQTYVVHRSLDVVGYYTLSFGSVALEESPESMATSMPPRYRVPVMLFARFAVAESLQGRGLGQALLKDAFLRTTAAAEIGGLAAILVDAINDEMVEFYIRRGFQKCPGYERKLMIAMKDIRVHLSEAFGGVR